MADVLEASQTTLCCHYVELVQGQCKGQQDNEPPSQATAALMLAACLPFESSDVVIDEANCPKLDSHKESKVGISTSVRDRRNSHNSFHHSIFDGRS